MNFALQRLRELRGGQSKSVDGELQQVASDPPPPPDILVADLPADWRVEWEERAAIREYDGGQTREHAEAEALREIIDRMTAAGVGRWKKPE